MFDANQLPLLPAYEWGREEKRAFLTRELGDLTRLHAAGCPEYARLMDAFGADADAARSFEELPFLPVRLFKEYALKSVPEENLYRTMTSSGTTGQQVSRIFLDRETSALQSKVLSRIVGEFLGKQRLPMIILDTSAVIKNRAMFSARGAGILGFSLFGRDKMYALDEEMKLDVVGLRAFLEKHEGETIFLFGFTFMIWQHFCAELRRLDFHPDLSRGVLIHGGGWKKLADQHITAERFKQELLETCGLTRVHDYYGMVEQTGTIYMECECGHLHAPVWSDITIRRPGDFSVADVGETGLIQVSSVLPRSYPGHLLLTEDEGRILGEDDCPCGRKGKYFEVLGRVKRAEVRGCSDTYELKRPSAAPASEALSGCEWLCGGDWGHARPLRPFAEPVLAFLSDLGAALLRDRAARAYPDVVTFAFFCRRANLEALQASYAGQVDDRLGRGLAFHIAPGNVPINFAYSLAAGLLAGNACVVKASSRDFAQTGMVCRAMDVLLKGPHAALAPYVHVARYPRERQDLTEAFSARCDARVVWGGDETVRRVRAAALPPRAVEVTFADRYSLLAASARTVLRLDDAQLRQAAQGFYNDTYLSDQNACTSPRLVYWLGTPEEVEEAQRRFWQAVRDYAQPRYPMEAVTAVDKRMAACRAAIGLEASVCPMPDNTVVRVAVGTLAPEVEAHRCAGGFFVEYASETMDALASIVTPKYQTLSYLGLEAEELRRFVTEKGLTGIDRVAPVGHTMDFALTWDGHDLIRELSRRISAF